MWALLDPLFLTQVGNTLFHNQSISLHHAYQRTTVFLTTVNWEKAPVHKNMPSLSTSTENCFSFQNAIFEVSKQHFLWNMPKCCLPPLRCLILNDNKKIPSTKQQAESWEQSVPATRKLGLKACEYSFYAEQYLIPHITVLKWNSCTVSIPIYLLLHLGHMLLPGNYENLFLQLKRTIYCIVVSWHHTLTRSLTAEERLSCSCYYWIGLSRCISFWQTKAFKIWPLFWQLAEFLSTGCHTTPADYFQSTLSGKQTTVHLQHRFSLGRKKESLEAVFAFRTMAGAQAVVCCTHHEMSSVVLVRKRVAITSSLPPLCRIALSPTCSLTFISPGISNFLLQ